MKTIIIRNLVNLICESMYHLDKNGNDKDYDNAQRGYTEGLSWKLKVYSYIFRKAYKF